MTEALSRWLKKKLTTPVLWVESLPGEDEPISDDERSLHTASGVAPSPLIAEPRLYEIKKSKDNAFRRGITVGRTPNNDLVIDDTSVSRFHAWFYQDDAGAWFVVDAGSKNGSWVSLKKLTAKKPVPLHGGERLRFGSVDATFLMPDKAMERLKRRLG